MKGRAIGLSSLAAGVLALAACVTINVYFPEAEIKDLSQKIEEQVQEQAAQEQASEEGEEPASGTTEDSQEDSQDESSSLLDTLLGVTPAFAAQSVPDPEITNPAIRKIISSRAARLNQVNEYKSLGVIGENNKALLDVQNLDGLSDLRARAEVQKLVRAENADRKQLFKEIAAAKNVDLSQLPKIQETYAETLRKAARPGDLIQMPDGDWKQKQ